MKKIFISYAKEDIHAAQEIYAKLLEKGFSPWLDQEKLVPGHDWEMEIEKAIEKSEIFLACLSSLSVSKTGFVQVELKRALEVAERMPEGKIFIIPVRLDECEAPRSLRHLQWVDYFSAEDKDKLYKAIQGKVTSPEHVEKSLHEWLSYNQAETVREHFRALETEKISVALVTLASKEAELTLIRSRAIKSLALYQKLDNSVWEKIIPTLSTELFDEWFGIWASDENRTVLDTHQIEKIFATRRLPRKSSGLGKAIMKFIERGAAYSSSVLIPGSQYPVWEVKYDCVRTIITLDDEDSLDTLAAFSTMSYWKARRRIIEYIAKRFDDAELLEEEIQIVARILEQIISDGKTEEKTPTMRAARETLQKISRMDDEENLDLNVGKKGERLYDAGERIRSIREEIWIEPSQTIEEINFFSKREYIAIENQEQEAPLSLLKSFAQLSGVRLEWLKHGKGPRYAVEALYFNPIERDLEFCASLNPQEYFLTLNEKNLHVGLVVQTGKYHYQFIKTEVTLNFWDWVESFWVIPAFYHFLERLSGPWHDIDGVVLPSPIETQLKNGEIHFLTAQRQSRRFGGDLLYDLLDLNETRSNLSSYKRKYRGTWMPRVHQELKKWLKELGAE